MKYATYSGRFDGTTFPRELHLDCQYDDPGDAFKRRDKLNRTGQLAVVMVAPETVEGQLARSLAEEGPRGG